jgi:DNA sulfur modification protein DndD
MKLVRLKLENFGPYFGEHEIDLSVTDNAPLIVIHGENERGKTTIANAIRWCLYNTAKGRGGHAIPLSRLLNNAAREAGRYNMAVTLEFSHEGVPYILERHVQADRLPTADTDFSPRLSLRKDGHFEAAGTVERTIRDMLHPQISRFFLFDGEMLNEYEDLLRDPNRNTEIVRQSIEQILGLPSLQKAASVLEEMRRAAERRQLNEARARRQNDALIARAQQAEEALTALEGDIENHKNLKARLEEERDQLRERLEGFGEVQADLRQLDRLEAELDQLDKESDEVREEIKGLIQVAWWIPLEGAIDQLVASASEQARAATEAQAGLSESKRRLAEIDDAIARTRCTVCEHLLTADDIQILEGRKSDLVAQIEELNARDGDAIGALTKLARLQPFAGSGNSRVLREKETAIRRIAIRRRRTTAEIEDIRERVRTDYRDEISHVERDLEQRLVQISRADGMLRDALGRHRDASGALQRLQNEIRSLPNANRRFAAEAEVYEALRDTFRETISEFREGLRKHVEREASSIHRELTTEPGYSGLKINEQYGLALVNEAGRSVMDRSAGSEQVVALSLIGALNHCATREGPIVMDTPFGRLDRGHRQHILEYAPQLGPQVILLVQSGEMERDRDLDLVRGSLAREFRIERDGASDRSRIVPL